MHIIETYFDACGFDHRLVQGGTSIYLWNLSRAFAAEGHRVSVVTPAHGQIDHIKTLQTVEELDYLEEYELSIPVDRAIWSSFPEVLTWQLETRAFRVSLDGVDIYLLSNEILDQLPDTFYPPYEAKGSDPVFFKPLIFQVDSIRFIRSRFAGERALIHAHEPFYHYLLPAAFRDDEEKSVVSVVQSNMPITKMVYRPEVDHLLRALGVEPNLPEGSKRPSDPFSVAMSQYQQNTHLHYEYSEDYVEIFALVADNADLVDFLSPGQLEFYSTFADTPFEQLFRTLSISDVVMRNAHKFFVGGCALADRWISVDASTVDRDSILSGIGLRPDRTTFFHNARYALNHKGQLELMKAIDRVLSDGLEANFIIRCLSGRGIDSDYFHDVASRHSGNVHLESIRVPEKRILEYAASSDYCVFPSKFELDTFLIAQGEAMACGAVPIATAQLGMAHFGHVADPLDGPNRDVATGFAINRSFSEDDPTLVDALVDRFRRAVRLLEQDPASYARLQANAVATARQFTWRRCTELHLTAFETVLEGGLAAISDDRALSHGWFDALSLDAWQSRSAEIAERAAVLGSVDVYARIAGLHTDSVDKLFKAAYARADFAVCERLEAMMPSAEHRDVATAVRGRCRIAPSSERGAWRVHYELPHAQKVQLVRADESVASRGKPLVTTFDRENGAFVADVDSSWQGEPLNLLVTLMSGRMAWDSVTPMSE